MAPVTLGNVKKAYGDLEVVHDISLAVRDGSFVALLGPSGCGKSILLHPIAGFEPITSVDVPIGADVVNDLHPKDRNIAMVFQNYALYAHMTVFDNMAFSMQLKKLPKDEIARKVECAASILNLTPCLTRHPGQLSGGQRQRVAMGRAIVRDPAVFLFDEPLSNLDAKLCVQMHTKIKELHERLKTTTLDVTHDQIEAMTIADVIVIMQDGYIEQVGAPLEVYYHPANLFVAEFIGSPNMNRLRGEVAAGNSVPSVRANGIDLPLPEGISVKLGQKVAYGMRPEHLKPSINGAGVIAKAATVEPSGPQTHIHADLAGEEVCAITQDRLAFTPGADIRLLPDLDRLQLFNQESGKAIHG